MGNNYIVRMKEYEVSIIIASFNNFMQKTVVKQQLN